jgi:hypothetical protein
VRRYTTSTDLEFDTPRSRQRADVSHALCNLLFLMRYEVMSIIDTAKVTSAEYIATSRRTGTSRSRVLSGVNLSWQQVPMTSRW